MLKSLILASTACFTFEATAQISTEWITQTDVFCQDMVVDRNGNIYLCGGYNSDYFTVKYSSTGQVLWLESYDGPAHADDWAVALALDNQDNVFVTGSTIDEWETIIDFTTLMYDTAGELGWEAHYDDSTLNVPQPVAIAVDSNDNVIVAAYNLNSAILTIQFDGAGQLQWVAAYSDSVAPIHVASAMTLDGQGNIYILGQLGWPAWSYGVLLKYDGCGQLQWADSLSNPPYTYQNASIVHLDNSGDILVGGYSYSATSGSDCFVQKYDPDGHLLVTINYNGSQGWDDYLSSLSSDAINKIYLAGVCNQAAPGYGGDWLIVKYNDRGQQLWSATYGDPDPDIGEGVWAMTLDDSENVYCTGIAWHEGSSDFLTTKHSSQGMLEWAVYYDNQDHGSDAGEYIALIDADRIIVKGRSYFPSTQNYVSTLIMYNQSTFAQPDSLEFVNAGAGDYILYPNYPNPFNGTTALSFELPRASHVSLRIYDTAGREVANLLDEWRQAGLHKVTLDGSEWPSGIYLCRLNAGNWSDMKKIFLIK